MDDQDAEREAVYLRVVVRVRRQRLRRHVGSCAGRLCELRARASLVQYHSGHAEVSNLGHHVGREEDVVRGEVAVYDGRRVAVEVGESQRDVQDDRYLEVARNARLGLKAGRHAMGEIFHDQHGRVRRALPVDTEELDDVGVAQRAKEKTLPLEFRQNRVLLLPSSRDQVVERLGSAKHPPQPHLLHGAERAPANRLSRFLHVLEQQRLQTLVKWARHGAVRDSS